MSSKINRLRTELANLASVTTPTTTLIYLICIVKSSLQIYRDGTLSRADEMMEKRGEYLVRYRGVDLRIPANRFSTIREMYARNIYIWPFDLTFRRGMTVLDFGCNEGFFSLYAAKCGSRTIGIDGQKHFAKAFFENMRRNNCEDCAQFVAGLLGIGFGLFGNRTESTRIISVEGSMPKIELDLFFDEHQIAWVDFMKIDIEGAEFGVFTGSMRGLERVSNIAMEVHAEWGHPMELVNILSERGFHVLATGNDLVPRDPTVAADGYLYASRARWRSSIRPLFAEA